MVCNASPVQDMVESLSCFLAAHATTPAFPLFLLIFSSEVLRVNFLLQTSVTSVGFEEKTSISLMIKSSPFCIKGCAG